jgi:hypothetical protein
MAGNWDTSLNGDNFCEASMKHSAFSPYLPEGNEGENRENSFYSITPLGGMTPFQSPPGNTTQIFKKTRNVRAHLDNLITTPKKRKAEEEEEESLGELVRCSMHLLMFVGSGL